LVQLQLRLIKSFGFGSGAGSGFSFVGPVCTAFQLKCLVFIIFFERILIQAKVGIHNFSPHLRNSAILRTTKMIAELRTKTSYGTAIADLQNLTSAIPQLCSLRPVQLLSYPFS
jgi:hypothetical protein